MAARTYRPAAFLRIYVRLDDFRKPTEEELLATLSEAEPFSEPAKRNDRLLARLKEKRVLAAADASQGGVDGATAALDARIKRVEREQVRVKKRLSGAAIAFADSLPTSAQTLEAGDAHSIVILTVPTDLDVELNGFRMADTLTASFPFSDAPLVSEIIKAALVEVFCGTLPAENFGKPNSWLLPLDVDKPNGRARIMFRGYVDEWETDHDDEDAKVTIKARSYEAVMIDAKINPRAKAYRIKGSGEKISEYVNRILALFPQTSGKYGDQFRAGWYGSPPSKEPTIDAKLLLRSLQTAASRNAQLSGGGAPDAEAPPAPQEETGDTAEGQGVGPAPGDPRLPPKAPGQDMSLWDLITQACELSGCLPTYEPSLPMRAENPGVKPLNMLLLRPAQTIFRRVDGGTRVIGGPIDGFSRDFTDQVTGQIVHSDLRFMVWGHNVKKLKTSRKLGKIKAQAIEVVSYNPDAGPADRTIRVRFPDNKKIGRMGAKGEGKVHEVKTIVVRGVRDKKALKQVAVSLYHQLARQELSVQVDTDDLASYIDVGAEGHLGRKVDHNDDPDLLKLRPGSPCRVTVAREQRSLGAGKTLVISPLSEVFEKRREQIAKMLRAQGARFQQGQGQQVDGASAAQAELFTDRIMTALGAAKLNDVFYCRSVKHHFSPSSDDGYSVSMELVNYVEPESDSKNLGPSDLAADEERREASIAATADAETEKKRREDLARERASLAGLL